MRKKRLMAAISLAAICTTGTMARAVGTLIPLASFTQATTGLEPYAGLVADSAGNLYGTTGFNGVNNSNGTIFELSGPNHQTLTTLYAFGGNGDNGEKPFGTLIIDSSGNLYGTTEAGGTGGGGGTVFEMPISNPSALTTLVSFNSSSGTSPFAGLTADASGNLYGTLAAGGAHGDGTVFSLTGTNHTTFNLLATFNGSNGSVPYGGLTFDSAGNLYGTTAAGGDSNGDGTVFKLSGTNHTTLTTLVQFNGSNGSLAEEGVTFGTDGNLYGTTAEGGVYGQGNVYRLSGTNFQNITNLYSFNGSNGTLPYSLPLFDAVGNLFGTTSTGGSAGNNGTIFELSGTNYQTFTQLQILDGTLSGPRGPLLNDSTGSLYGTTTAGGASANGAAFQLSGSGFASFLPAVNVSTGVTFHLNVATGYGNRLIPIDGIALSLGATLLIDSSPGKTRVAVDHYHKNVAFSSGSTVNLEDNGFDFDTGNASSGQISLPGVPASVSNLATATVAVGQGYNQGNWNGTTGFTSSTAGTDTTHMTAIGVIQNNQSGTAIFSSANPFGGEFPGPGDILLKYTYYGDANLDGVVDGSDYSLVDAGYLSNGTLTGWYYGDFNYDGVTDASDYTLMDNVFNTQGAALTASLDATPTTQIAEATTAVPEPGLQAVLAIASAAMLALRRRRSLHVY